MSKKLEIANAISNIILSVISAYLVYFLVMMALSHRLFDEIVFHLAAALGIILSCVAHFIVVAGMKKSFNQFKATFVPYTVVDEYFRDLKDQIRRGRIAEEQIQREGGETHHETFSAFKRSVYARMKVAEKLANLFDYYPDATMPRCDAHIETGCKG